MTIIKLGLWFSTIFFNVLMQVSFKATEAGLFGFTIKTALMSVSFNLFRSSSVY